METMMEHLAMEQGADPLQFRIDHLLQEGDMTMDNQGVPYSGVNPLIAMIDQLKTDSDYVNRLAEVAAFNESNIWKKKGLVMLPMRWRHKYGATMHYACQVRQRNHTRFLVEKVEEQVGCYHALFLS